MIDRPENLTSVYLRRLDGKHRVTTLEIQVGQFAATETSHYAGTALRLDRIEERLERLERHADIVPV